MVWAWNRLRGRRDMVLVQATLRRQPLLWGFEVYRPKSILAGDARHAARQEGWPESELDEFGLAAAAEHGTRLARDLVAELDVQRRRLVRLSARRTGHHLTLALNVPDADRFEPTELTRVVRRLAQRMAS
jgi:hypothetical protein